MNQIQNAHFIISDITGYTMFLTRSELDHAQDILKALFDAQLQQIKPPLRVSNFQGDAILMYVPQQSVLQEQTLLEIIESIYFAFARQLEVMRMATTCSCNACANMSGLDLKLFVHYGQCMIQRVGDREELIGSDVILVHRMLKNTVTETTGVRAYTLFSAQAADSLRVRDYCEGLIEHSEEYEYVGRVPMLIHPLGPAWEKERHKRRLLVAREDAWLVFEDEVPGPLALIWDHMTRMDLKTGWMGVDVEERIDDLGGRNGEGSAYHCAHGDMHVYYHVLDWEPLHHITFNQKFPDLPEVLVTYVLEALSDDSARFSVYATKPDADLPDEAQGELQEAFVTYFGGLRRAMQQHLLHAHRP